MTNTIHYYVLSLGYVEDSTLPVLILANGGGFTNAWDAMRSLAQVLTEWAQAEKPAKCGKKNLADGAWRVLPHPTSHRWLTTLYTTSSCVGSV